MAEEKTFENKIKKFLETQNCWFVKYWAGAPYTVSGIPDLLACVNSRFVGIEVKAEKGKLSELQKNKICEIRKSGGIAFVVYPSDFAKLKSLIIKLKSNERIECNECSKKNSTYYAISYYECEAEEIET